MFIDTVEVWTVVIGIHINKERFLKFSKECLCFVINYFLQLTLFPKLMCYILYYLDEIIFHSCHKN